MIPKPSEKTKGKDWRELPMNHELSSPSSMEFMYPVNIGAQRETVSTVKQLPA
jgi:hypothetical protein